MENQVIHPESEKRISTTVGVVILVLITIIIGLVAWKMKGDTDLATNAPVVPAPVVKVPKETMVVPEATPPAIDKTPIDFDKELKDLDTAAGAFDSTDFGDTGLSDANLGL